MLIVADQNMPLLDEYFAGWGEIRRLPGRAMTAADVADADLLLVRSVTRVDARLLAEARPRFVGSATIGTDHVDLSYLAGCGIPFANAAGCNALAVAEYVATVLALHSERVQQPLAGLRLGVVGCGHVGQAVLGKARALGLAVAGCDPLAPVPDGVEALALAELLTWADVVSLHVPLTDTGPHPTRHLLAQSRLRAGRWQLLINTARGPVVDNQALAALLAAEPGRAAVLDVWEQEPVVPPMVLERVWLGTPHVAGYSLEGKWRGTDQVYRAACLALGRTPTVTLGGIRAVRRERLRELPWAGSLAATLQRCCDIPADDARLRAVVTGDAAATAQAFDCLRTDYPERREFAAWLPTAEAQVKTPRGLLAALGFSGC